MWLGQFAPFGGELVNGAPLTPGTPDGSSSHYKFTGKERDSESGLDYFGARYYASSMGRWMSPDWSAKEDPVPYAKLDDPQSLNLYGYVGNNPLSKADADGHEGCCTLTDLAELVDKGAAEGQAMIAAAGGGASVVGSARWGLLAGPALYIGAMIHPTTVGQSDADEMAQRDQLDRENQEHKDAAPEPQTSSSGAGARQGGGAIYKVPGSGTQSGKPYIGRHNKPDPSKTRKSKDGRDRSKAEVVDTYNASDTTSGRQKEQQQIDAHGGVTELDNKRNEVKKP